MTDDSSFHTIRTLRRSEMYRAMKDALDSLTQRDIVYLTSFQTEHPLEQRDSDDLVVYHEHFFQRAVQLGKEVEFRRLLAIQKIEKLSWIDTLISQFNNGNANFNLRAYPAQLEWRSNGGLEPLPIQVQIIAGHVFAGATKDNPEQIDPEIFGIQIDPCERTPDRVNHYFVSHHEALWQYASKHDRSDLIVRGRVNDANVTYYKWMICSDWLAFNASRVSSADHLPRFKRDVSQKLLPINGWFKHHLTAVHIRESYERYPLTSKGRTFDGSEAFASVKKCEVMIAQWNPRMMCWPHDHGGSSGVVFILQGRARVTEYKYDATLKTLKRDTSVTLELQQNDVAEVKGNIIHAMESIGEDQLVTLHVYVPAPKTIWIYDLHHQERLQIVRGGAFEPFDSTAIKKKEPCKYVESIDTDSVASLPRGNVKRGPRPDPKRRLRDAYWYDLWAKGKGKYKTKADLARALHETPDDVVDGLERERQRRKSQGRATGNNLVSSDE